MERGGLTSFAMHALLHARASPCTHFFVLCHARASLTEFLRRSNLTEYATFLSLCMCRNIVSNYSFLSCQRIDTNAGTQTQDGTHVRRTSSTEHRATVRLLAAPVLHQARRSTACISKCGACTTADKTG
jgi:hypothetical protein